MRRLNSVVLGSVVAAWAAAGSEPVPAHADSSLVIVVSQDGSGDFSGTDEEPIRAAITKARQTGGATIQIGPGHYLIRRGLKLSSGITIKG
ncbi:MAG: hypothetical protein ABIP48_28750, partial [Planctomycetota bacterium]